MYLNHVIPSSRCLPPIPGRTFKSSFGHSVGTRHHLKLFQNKLLDNILFLLYVTKLMFSTHWWVMKVRDSNWKCQQFFFGYRFSNSPFMTSDQSVPSTGTQWINVDTGSWSGRSHHKPPMEKVTKHVSGVLRTALWFFHLLLSLTHYHKFMKLPFAQANYDTVDVVSCRVLEFVCSQ